MCRPTSGTRQTAAQLTNTDTYSPGMPLNGLIPMKSLDADSEELVLENDMLEENYFGRYRLRYYSVQLYVTVGLRGLSVVSLMLYGYTCSNYV